MPVWISNHMPSKVCNEITYLFLDVNGSSFEISKYFHPTCYRGCNYFSMIGSKLMVVKGPWEKPALLSASCIRIRHIPGCISMTITWLKPSPVIMETIATPFSDTGRRFWCVDTFIGQYASQDCKTPAPLLDPWRFSVCWHDVRLYILNQ